MFWGTQGIDDSLRFLIREKNEGKKKKKKKRPHQSHSRKYCWVVETDSFPIAKSSCLAVFDRPASPSGISHFQHWKQKMRK